HGVLAVLDLSRGTVFSPRGSRCALLSVRPREATSRKHSARATDERASRRGPGKGILRGIARRRLTARFGLLDPELLHLAVQVGALDAQVLGGLAQVSRLRRGPVEDVVPLEAVARVAQRQGLVRFGFLVGLADEI